MNFANGQQFTNFTFKDGKTPTVDMITIFKQERGANALKKLQSAQMASSKARVTGGLKMRKTKAMEKAAGANARSDIKKLAEKISKFSPGRASNSAAKRSTHRILTGKSVDMPSPGAGSQVGTTNHQSMEEFKKMVAYFNKKYKGSGTGSGKKSLGKRASGKGSGKLSSKTLKAKDGKKSQK